MRSPIRVDTRKRFTNGGTSVVTAAEDQLSQDLTDRAAAAARRRE